MKENIRVSFTLLTYNSDLRQRGSQCPNSAQPRILARTTAKKNKNAFFLSRQASKAKTKELKYFLNFLTLVPGNMARFSNIAHSELELPAAASLTRSRRSKV